MKRLLFYIILCISIITSSCTQNRKTELYTQGEPSVILGTEDTCNASIDKKVIIICSSENGSTRQLVNAIAEKYEIKVVLHSEIENSTDLQDYDLIGFSSGIQFGKCHRSIARCIALLPTHKKCFFLYTCDNIKESYAENTRELVIAQACDWRGAYGCTGAAITGKLLSRLTGKETKRPTKEQKEHAVAFYERLVK